jgi:hypothetical protein
MKATEFMNEESFGTTPARPLRTGSRPTRSKHDPSELVSLKKEPIKKVGVSGLDDAELDERGQASRALCTSSKPDAELGASMLSSCKSQGLRARDGKKSHLIGKKRITVGGKKIKGKAHGGPLPDYS